MWIATTSFVIYFNRKNSRVEVDYETFAESEADSDGKIVETEFLTNYSHEIIFKRLENHGISRNDALQCGVCNMRGTKKKLEYIRDPFPAGPHKLNYQTLGRMGKANGRTDEAEAERFANKVESFLNRAISEPEFKKLLAEMITNARPLLYPMPAMRMRQRRQL